MISYCGILCDKCEAYIATKNNDKEKMKEIAAKWSTNDYIVKPEDIPCEGCASKSNKIFRFCGECEIRLCGISKQIDNCGYCSEYPCGKLERTLENCPENKEILDGISKTS